MRRLAQRATMPKSEPQAVRIEFEDGACLVNLGLSLHSGCPAPWLAEVCGEWAKPEWLLVGVDYGEEASFIDHVGRLEAQRLLVRRAP